MTRLESSARDYAIAYISAAPSSTVAMGILPLVVGPAYSRAVEIVAAEESLRVGGIGLHRWPEAMAYARRLVRARVALYLRMMRRVEAWETWERTGAVSQLRGTGGKRSFRYVDMGDHVALVAFATPWRPLWTSAPPHEPGVTARTRREEK